MSKVLHVIVLVLVSGMFVGCASKTPRQTGFLSDYENLKVVDSTRMRYVSDDLKNYSSYIIDPVELRMAENPSALSPKERAEVAVYFRNAFIKVLTDRGYPVVTESGVGVARVRIALTDIQESTWWMNVHPASKLSGAGKGGASMEGEIIDSVTGEQLAAVVQAGKGNQFELDTFSKLDDVEDTIDAWAKTAGQRLDELRAKK